MILFRQVNPLNWIQNLPTRNWRCHMTTWRWSGMRPRPKKATARTVSPARAAMAWLGMSTLTVVGTTGKPWLVGAHGEGKRNRNIDIWNKPMCFRVYTKITKTIWQWITELSNQKKKKTSCLPDVQFCITIDCDWEASPLFLLTLLSRSIVVLCSSGTLWA